MNIFSDDKKYKKLMFWLTAIGLIIGIASIYSDTVRSFLSSLFTPKVEISITFLAMFIIGQLIIYFIIKAKYIHLTQHNEVVKLLSTQHNEEIESITLEIMKKHSGCMKILHNLRITVKEIECNHIQEIKDIICTVHSEKEELDNAENLINSSAQMFINETLLTFAEQARELMNELKKVIMYFLKKHNIKKQNVKVIFKLCDQTNNVGLKTLKIRALIPDKDTSPSGANLKVGEIFVADSTALEESIKNGVYAKNNVKNDKNYKSPIDSIEFFTSAKLMLASREDIYNNGFLCVLVENSQSQPIFLDNHQKDPIIKASTVSIQHINSLFNFMHMSLENVELEAQKKLRVIKLCKTYDLKTGTCSNDQRSA